MRDLILPERYIDARLDEKTNSNIALLVRDYVVNFATKYQPQGIGPALFGTAGVGKTHAAAVIAKVLSSKGIDVVWCSTVDDLNAIIDSRDYRSSSYFTKKRELKDSELVIFDDFSQLSEYQRLRELFFEIINHRYSWKKSTVFTANFEVKNNQDWENVVGRAFTAAIARRIQLMSQGLVFSS